MSFFFAQAFLTIKKLLTMFDEKQEFVKVTAISLNSHCPVSLCCSEESLCVARTWRVGTLVVVFDKLVKDIIDYGC